MSALRKHDWEYDLDLAHCFTRYYCRQCSCYKIEHRDGTVKYARHDDKDLSDEPCCSPPFDPDITPEELDRAGYMLKPKPPPWLCTDTKFIPFARCLEEQCDRRTNCALVKGHPGGCFEDDHLSDDGRREYWRQLRNGPG